MDPKATLDNAQRALEAAEKAPLGQRFLLAQDALELLAIYRAWRANGGANPKVGNYEFGDARYEALFQRSAAIADDRPKPTAAFKRDVWYVTALKASSLIPGGTWVFLEFDIQDTGLVIGSTVDPTVLDCYFLNEEIALRHMTKFLQLQSGPYIDVKLVKGTLTVEVPK